MMQNECQELMGDHMNQYGHFQESGLVAAELQISLTLDRRGKGL